MAFYNDIFGGHNRKEQAKEMTDREDPFVERGPRDEIVIQEWEMEGFLRWFRNTCPKSGPKWTVCWEDWRGMYDMETNRISWDYSVAGMAEAEHRRRRPEVVFTGPGNGIELNPVPQMIPAIVMPEPKPYYGLGFECWTMMNNGQRQEAKNTYLESTSALKSIYEQLLKPIVVVK